MMLMKMQKNPNEHQVAFYKWQLNQAKSVKCRSYKSDPQLKKIIENIFKYSEVEQKQCYKNSWMVAAMSSKAIDVVVGFSSAIGIVPIEHAWNFYKPKKIYFDLTFEKCLGKDVTKEQYLQIVKQPSSKVGQILSSTRFEIMGFMGAWYDKKVAK
jgi:hypothetical protein